MLSADMVTTTIWLSRTMTSELYHILIGGHWIYHIQWVAFAGIVSILLIIIGSKTRLQNMFSCVENVKSPRPVLSRLLAIFMLCLSHNAQSKEIQPDIATGSAILDSSRLFALGMIETGNDDRGVGRDGEISRYQIHPVVWKAYSMSRDYHNPEVALEVARQHWAALSGYFREKTARQPSDFDMYVLWNTRYGFYAAKGFDPQRLPRHVSGRAQRFVNLVNRKV
jgi:hypothetical protein